MKIFEHPNTSGDWKCPICNTNEDKPVTLIGIEGTEDSSIMEAEHFHIDCIYLTYNKDYNLLYTKI